jgi:CubicO group peptidase (beta-lactamase class C family)
VRRRQFLAVASVGPVAALAACTGVNAGPPTSTAEAAPTTAATPSSTARPWAPPTPQNPGQIPGVPTNAVFVGTAIRKVDSLSRDIMDQTGIPGMAVAVVHGGEIVFAQGYGVRDIGKPDKVDADTVFQLASLSKPLGATVVATEVGAGAVAWDTPIVTHLPTFTLADPYVTQNVTIADMYSHRSGLPSHAADLLEDIGFEQQEIFDRLRFLPLNPFRAIYNYTNLGLTAGAEAVAAAAGTDWATLSERDVYAPLGMTATSSRFSDYQANADRAVGHVKTESGYAAKYVRDADAESPAGGVSSSVNDVATWLAMVLRGGTAADGTAVVDPAALRAALTPVIRSADGSPVPPQIDARTSFYGYGFGVATDSTGRVELSHSGAFALGFGTSFLAFPNLDLGIVVLTNAAANGTAEALTHQFADIAKFGSVQLDWLAGYQRALAGVSAPVGSLVGETAPANPAPASPNAAYVGAYGNDFYGPLTISDSAGALVLAVGPKNMQFPLTHWDGQIFTMVPTGENAPDGSISMVTFALAGDTASAVTVEFFHANQLGTFRR